MGYWMNDAGEVYDDDGRLIEVDGEDASPTAEPNEPDDGLL